MNRFLKIGLPWVLTLLGVAGILWFRASVSRTTAELATLKPQAAELLSLRAENLEMDGAAVAPEAAAAVRTENAELLKLRNDARRLRDDKVQLNRQLQSAQTQAARMRSGSGGPASPQPAAPATAQGTTAAEVAQLLSPADASRPATPEEMRNACINNLRQIDGAKQQWALENKKPVTSLPTATDISVNIGNNLFPVCPAGGAYSINAVNAAPTCSIPGHALPQ
jgi:hypothetical protein